jgi:hypothetical protein
MVKRALELKREIEELIAADHDEHAVILTQTLLKVRLEADLYTYALDCDEPRAIAAATALLPSFNLRDGRVRGFVETLIGERIDSCDEHGHWAQMQEYGQLRNRLVHGGEQTVGADEANGFLDAVLEVTRIVRARLLLALAVYDEDDARDDERWVSRRSRSSPSPSP